MTEFGNVSGAGRTRCVGLEVVWVMVGLTGPVVRGVDPALVVRVRPFQQVAR